MKPEGLTRYRVEVELGSIPYNVWAFSPEEAEQKAEEEFWHDLGERNFEIEPVDFDTQETDEQEWEKAYDNGDIGHLPDEQKK
ncbi:MAG: hypothetical protein HYX86_00760 [Chloroflexi bacterium]|nr:hypothetical protein [Chloroflexota bacterium]